MEVEKFYWTWFESGNSSDTVIRRCEEACRGRAVEKVHNEFIDQLSFDALHNLIKKKPASRLLLAIRDFLQILILGAILICMGILIVWL